MTNELALLANWSVRQQRVSSVQLHRYVRAFSKPNNAVQSGTSSGSFSSAMR